MIRVDTRLALAFTAGLAALLFAGAVVTGQKRTDFDPAKKGAWQFLDDDLDLVRIEGAKAQQRGDYKTAARQYLTYLYRNGRDLRVVYALARCYSRMGDAESAVELLTRATQRGFARPELFEADKELDPVRETRAFKSREKSLAALSETLGGTMAVSGPRLGIYRLRLPAGYDATRAYTLVVGLHGNGSNAVEMMQAMPAAAMQGMICAAPEGAYPRTDLAGLSGEHFSWYLPDADRALWPSLDALTSEQVMRVVDDVSQRHSVSRVVLLGFSQGVSVAYLAATKRPDRIAGIAAFAGGFPRSSVTPEQLKAASRIRVLIGHGTGDTQVGIEASERARDLLRDAGFKVQYETFDGGHSLPPEAIQRAADWIRSWK